MQGGRPTGQHSWTPMDGKMQLQTENYEKISIQVGKQKSAPDKIVIYDDDDDDEVWVLKYWESVSVNR